MGLGELPKAYNKAIHGPYDPAVFYGKKDVPLGQVSEIQINCFIINSNLYPGEAPGCPRLVLPTQHVTHCHGSGHV